LSPYQVTSFFQWLEKSSSAAMEFSSGWKIPSDLLAPDVEDNGQEGYEQDDAEHHAQREAQQVYRH